MRYAITILILTILVKPSIGQIQPTLNDEDVLKSLKVKSLSTFYYDNEDTTKSTKTLLFKKEYDLFGNLISTYHLSLWDVVSYDYTTSYSYDKNNNLIEKVVIQKILNLGKRDEKFIREMGDDPVNEKFNYYYNGDNQLIKRERFSFGKEGFSKNQKPNNTVTFKYAKGLLVKEVSSGALISESYIASFDYNNLKQKIKQTVVFTTASSKTPITTIWRYNDKGLVTEEFTDNKAYPRHNKHIRYEYDDKDRITQELHLSYESNTWESIKNYTYDKTGNLILVNDETTFDYYQNGLVKRELWKSKDSDEAVNLITIYKFRQQQ